jgi:dTDP-glucose pyrophosphorylase
MRTNLILLAGRGKRFSDAGYKLPKPLIKVDNKPMVIAAASHLPPADEMVFVVSGNIANNLGLTKVIKKYYPKAIIVVQRSPLQGQAHSALLAERVINPNSELIIASCDAGPIYDQRKLVKALKDPATDSLIWAFRHYPPMVNNPTSYGWIAIDRRKYVKKVQYKVPLSKNPLNDYAVVGWFSYKSAKLCFENIKYMIKHNLKSGSEFSLDECTNVLIKRGKKVKIFEIDVFKSWGTPTELKTYQYWQNYFKLNK